MVGKAHPELQGYFQKVLNAIQQLGLGRSVKIVFSATAEQLRAIYLAAHAFLCLSEHEGFCVPLVEAMLHKIPIVALARTAVPETTGQAGLLTGEMDEALFAEMLACVLEEEPTRRWLTSQAYERYQQHFSMEAIRQRFLHALGPLLKEN
jgi:glycosyltransferase involved in cell wall biosynthesis